jgi:hypothetical protein
MTNETMGLISLPTYNGMPPAGAKPQPPKEPKP